MSKVQAHDAAILYRLDDILDDGSLTDILVIM
jgi:hypothetical protein